MNIVYTMRYFNRDDGVHEPDYLFTGPSIDRLQEEYDLDFSVIEDKRLILGVTETIKGLSPEISKERVRFIKAVLRMGIITSEAVIRWCDETIEELQRSEA